MTLNLGKFIITINKIMVINNNAKHCNNKNVLT